MRNSVPHPREEEFKGKYFLFNTNPLRCTGVFGDGTLYFQSNPRIWNKDLTIYTAKPLEDWMIELIVSEKEDRFLPETFANWLTRQDEHVNELWVDFCKKRETLIAQVFDADSQEGES